MQFVLYFYKKYEKILTKVKNGSNLYVIFLFLQGEGYERTYRKKCTKIYKRCCLLLSLLHYFNLPSCLWKSDKLGLSGPKRLSLFLFIKIFAGGVYEYYY